MKIILNELSWCTIFPNKTKVFVYDMSYILCLSQFYELFPALDEVKNQLIHRVLTNFESVA